jgi:hypothetical protein
MSRSEGMVVLDAWVGVEYSPMRAGTLAPITNVIRKFSVVAVAP